MTHPIFGADHPADQVLADFGVDLAIPAAPTVTRGLIKSTMPQRETGRGDAVVAREVVLKVKRNAFAHIAQLAGTRVTVTYHSGAQEEYTIDSPVAREESWFDYFALHPYRVKAGA